MIHQRYNTYFFFFCFQNIKNKDIFKVLPELRLKFIKHKLAFIFFCCIVIVVIVFYATKIVFNCKANNKNQIHETKLLFKGIWLLYDITDSKYKMCKCNARQFTKVTTCFYSAYISVVFFLLQFYLWDSLRESKQENANRNNKIAKKKKKMNKQEK